jgi:hypothetical protein
LRYLLSKKGHVGCRFNEMRVMEFPLLNDRIVTAKLKLLLLCSKLVLRQ